MEKDYGGLEEGDIRILRSKPSRLPQTARTAFELPLHRAFHAVARLPQPYRIAGWQPPIEQAYS